MTTPDYPLLALGGYETYQLAHIATYIAERLGRHHRSGRGRDGRAARVEAVRDIAGAATALGNATGRSIPGHELPQPLDIGTYTAAQQLLKTGSRTADVVALAGMGRSGFAVVGHVPGLGAVGVSAGSKDVADALRTHLLTRPAAELAPWVVTQTQQRMPTLPRRVDLAAFVEHLDPARDDDRAVARNLRGHNRRTDTAIRGRFAGVDLDAPAVVTPSALPQAPVTGRRTGPRRSANHRTNGRVSGIRRPGSQSAAAPTVARTIAGP